VRYLRCPADHLPSIPELQLLVPHGQQCIRAGRSRRKVRRRCYRARRAWAASVASRRRERTTLWQDSGFFHDSFFSPDRRADAPAASTGG
jgi:hypothetical protein